jgi:ElaB/YqjD/DUF883 family membrane-anchored ribosome-binding protein
MIHHQMEEKRASLAEKLDAAEKLVLGTVQGATAEVTNIVQEVKSTVGTVTEEVKSTVGTVKEGFQDTVASVKEGLQETVETVKDAFDIRDRVRRHPWVSLGSAFAVGLGGAYLLGPGRPVRDYLGRAWEQAEALGPRRETGNGFHATAAAMAPAAAAQPSAEREEEPSPLADAGKEALKTLSSLALGTLMGVVREMVTPSLPDAFRGDVKNMLNDFTTRIGGKLLPENFLGSEGGEHEHGDRAGMGRGRL